MNCLISAVPSFAADFSKRAVVEPLAKVKKNHHTRLHSISITINSSYDGHEGFFLAHGIITVTKAFTPDPHR